MLQTKISLLAKTMLPYNPDMLLHAKCLIAEVGNNDVVLKYGIVQDNLNEPYEVISLKSAGVMNAIACRVGIFDSLTAEEQAQVVLYLNKKNIS